MPNLSKIIPLWALYCCLVSLLSLLWSEDVAPSWVVFYLIGTVPLCVYRAIYQVDFRLVPYGIMLGFGIGCAMKSLTLYYNW